MFKIVNDESVEVPSALEGGVGLDELCRLAAQEMLAVALETERRAYLDAHAAVTDERGHRVVVGNGPPAGPGGDHGSGNGGGQGPTGT